MTSKYQAAIYDWVENGSGDGAVDAVAGSGKTTTLVEAAKHVKASRIGYFAFNKSIADELTTRLPATVTVKTINALGHNAIEFADNAAEGVVTTVAEDKLAETLQSGDLVLCRVTAPLVKLCIKLIKNRVPARVKGRDIAKNLVGTAKEALGKGDWAQFNGLLDEYLSAQIAKLSSRKYAEAQIEALRDKVEGIRACYEAFDAATFADFATEVEAIFSDGTSIIELSTVHRAKGLQAKRVFVIESGKLPLTWKGQLPWQYEQELNLKYVAITRAQEALYWVAGSTPAPVPAMAGAVAAW